MKPLSVILAVSTVSGATVDTVLADGVDVATVDVEDDDCEASFESDTDCIARSSDVCGGEPGAFSPGGGAA